MKISKQSLKLIKSRCTYNFIVRSGEHTITGGTNASSPDAARRVAMQMFAHYMLEDNLPFDPFNATVVVIKTKTTTHESNP